MSPEVTKRPGIKQRVMDLFRFRLLVRCWQLAAILLSPYGSAWLYLMYRKDLTGQVKIFEARLPLTVEMVDRHRIAAVVPEIEGADRQVADLAERRAYQGQWLFAARADSRLVAYDWVCPAPERVPGGVIHPGPGEVYCTDAYTRPEWRGRNIHTELHSRMLQHARSLGVRTAFTLVNMANPKSWKAVVRLNWKVSGIYLYLNSRTGKREHLWLLWGDPYPFVKLPGKTARPVAVS